MDLAIPQAAAVLLEKPQCDVFSSVSSDMRIQTAKVVDSQAHYWMIAKKCCRLELFPELMLRCDSVLP